MNLPTDSFITISHNKPECQYDHSSLSSSTTYHHQNYIIRSFPPPKPYRCRCFTHLIQPIYMTASSSSSSFYIQILQSFTHPSHLCLSSCIIIIIITKPPSPITTS